MHAIVQLQISLRTLFAINVHVAATPLLSHTSDLFFALLENTGLTVQSLRIPYSLLAISIFEISTVNLSSRVTDNVAQVSSRRAATLTFIYLDFQFRRSRRNAENQTSFPSGHF